LRKKLNKISGCKSLKKGTTEEIKLTKPGTTMRKIEQFQNIKLDIQTVDFDPSSDIMSIIRAELRKLMRIYGNIVGADIYLQQSNPSEPQDKVARIRVGVPGKDLFAEATSSTWGQALSEVTGKLRNQILRRH
jgi:putative sigma-54 modulation protein